MLANNNTIIYASSSTCTEDALDNCSTKSLELEEFLGLWRGEREQCKSYCKGMTGFDAAELYSRADWCVAL